MPRPKRIIVRLRVLSRARDLSNDRLSSSEAHRGGQRKPIVSHSVHVTISNDWTGILPGFWNEVRAWYEGPGHDPPHPLVARWRDCLADTIYSGSTPDWLQREFLALCIRSLLGCQM